MATDAPQIKTKGTIIGMKASNGAGNLPCVVPNALVTTTKLRKHFFQPFGDLRCKGQHLAIDQYFR